MSRVFFRWHDWKLIPKWTPFTSPLTGNLLWSRVYFGPIEIRRYPEQAP